MVALLLNSLKLLVLVEPVFEEGEMGDFVSIVLMARYAAHVYIEMDAMNFALH